MAKELLRPIDICDECDGLFPLVLVTPTVRALKFEKIWVSNGVFARLHHGCVATWRSRQ